jgi:hypothetical protein
LDLGPPAHLSICFGKIFLSLKDACLDVNEHLTPLYLGNGEIYTKSDGILHTGKKCIQISL